MRVSELLPGCVVRWIPSLTAGSDTSSSSRRSMLERPIHPVDHTRASDTSSSSRRSMGSAYPLCGAFPDCINAEVYSFLSSMCPRVVLTKLGGGWARNTSTELEVTQRVRDFEQKMCLRNFSPFNVEFSYIFCPFNQRLQ